MNVRVVVHNDGDEHVLIEMRNVMQQEDGQIVIPPGHQHTLPHGWHLTKMSPIHMSTERHHG